MAALSKEEYLKRYLSSSDSGPKKKRKKKMKVVAKSGKSLIIDDDVNLSDILVNHDTASEENLLDGAEENPLIFDEAGTTVLSKDLETIKKKEEERKAMWAPVRNVNEEDSKPEGSFKELDSSNGDILVDRRKTHDRVSPVRSKIRHRGSLSPDLSPPRERRSDSAHELGIKLKQGDLERSLSDELPQRQPRYDSVDLSLARRGRHDSPDMSPPRRGRHDSPDMSPPRRGKHDPPDMSPPRRQRHDLADNSPPKRQRHDSPDMSSLRRQRHDSPDMSPPRRQRHDSADMSPPRRQRHDSADMSPPRRQRHDSPDMPTHRRKQHESFRRQRHDFSSDQSPPRRCESPPGQMSPLRRQRVSNNKGVVGRTSHGTSDSSPVRRGSNAKDSFFDGPPSRGSESRDKMAVRQRTRHESPDQSPPRGVKEKDHVSPGVYKWERDKGSQDLSPKRREPAKTERKAGLHSAAELRRENELNKTREDDIFSRMSSSATGKGAKTVHRDKMGRKRDLKIEKAMKKEEERKKLEEDEKFMEWGKGLHQTRKGKEKVQDDMYEMSKPLARYKDDEDLDQMLKDRDRSGDPMLAFLQKKKAKQDVLIGKKEKPRYKGPAPPPNRFNIQPGYRWDGVDRSNGFEKKRFMMLANKGATREEAYKWSTEDM